MKLIWWSHTALLASHWPINLDTAAGAFSTYFGSSSMRINQYITLRYSVFKASLNSMTSSSSLIIFYACILSFSPRSLSLLKASEATFFASFNVIMCRAEVAFIYVLSRFFSCRQRNWRNTVYRAPCSEANWRRTAGDTTFATCFITERTMLSKADWSPYEKNPY